MNYILLYDLKDHTTRILGGPPAFKPGCVVLAAHPDRDILETALKVAHHNCTTPGDIAEYSTHLHKILANPFRWIVTTRKPGESFTPFAPLKGEPPTLSMCSSTLVEGREVRFRHERAGGALVSITARIPADMPTPPWSALI